MTKDCTIQISKGTWLALLVALIINVFTFGLAMAADDSQPPPVQLTAAQDHQRTMDLLQMTQFRRRTTVNYDESQANPYPDLPDPLTLHNGQKVTTPEMWWNLRRPEIVEDYQREFYGRVPKVTPTVHWEVTSTTNRSVTNADMVFSIIEKQLLGQVDNSSYTNISIKIQLSLTLPANAAGPSPVLMVLAPWGGGGGFGRGGFRGGAPGTGATTNATGTAGTNRVTGTNAPRGGGFGGSRGGLQAWQAMALSNGWGYATLNTYTVQADGGAGFTSGIIGLCNKGQPRKLDDWGVLQAWAWGASRALDYFESDKAVDAKQVGLEGHSRWGKAAMVAMAFDQRFAIVYSSSSGLGGATINRRNYGEVLEHAAWSDAYHWYAGNFIKYAGPLTAKDLPVDGHELIALCAPRPVFIGGGNTNDKGGDGHADPKGMFMAAAAAGPVYTLLGKKSLGTDIFPPIETALIDGDVAYREHSGGHTDAPNWPTFMTFARRYLKSPGLKPVSSDADSGK